MIEYIYEISDVVISIAPVIAASLIAGGSALAGSAINAASINATNKRNLAYQNSVNQQMIDFAREQTRVEQQYNSIGEQMKRAIAAGVNPMLLAGVQPTSASSSSTPSLDPPIAQNVFSGHGLQATGSTVANLILQDQGLKLQSNQLELEDFKTRVDMLKTIGQISGSSDWTSSEMRDVIDSIMGDKYGAFDIPSLARDQLNITKIQNSIETSNIDKDTKKYMYGWLDEFTNAQYTNLLADNELKQTQSIVNRSLAKLNDEKRKEIDQAIKNMQEQWKSLHFEGEFSLKKLEHVMKLTDAFVRKYHYEAGVSELDFRNYVFNKYISSSGVLGGVFGTGSGIIHGVSFPNKNY